MDVPSDTPMDATTCTTMHTIINTTMAATNQQVYGYNN